MLHSNKIVELGLKEFKIHIKISNSSSESIMRCSSNIVKSTVHTQTCTSQLYMTGRVNNRLIFVTK